MDGHMTLAEIEAWLLEHHVTYPSSRIMIGLRLAAADLAARDAIIKDMSGVLTDLVEINRRDNLTDPNYQPSPDYVDATWSKARAAISRSKGKVHGS